MRIPTLTVLLPALILCARLPATASGKARHSAGAHKAAASPCSYAYDGLAFDKADKKQSFWKVGVKVSNHSDRPVSLEGMRYSLLHQQDTLLSDWKPSDQVVQPGESATLQAILSLPNKVLKKLPKNVLKDPQARFTLVGDAYQEEPRGLVRFPKAVQQTIEVDMPKQMAKARRMFFRNLFSA